IRLGLQALADLDVEGVAVLPVDHPAVAPATVAHTIQVFRASSAPIVRTVRRGQGGHPTVFARRIFDELLDPDLEGGARTVIYAHHGERVDIETEDPGAVADIDTPDDYRNLL